MFLLFEEFNGVVVSRHRTIEAAMRARDRQVNKLQRATSPRAYLVYSLRVEKNGAAVYPTDGELDRFYGLNS